MKWCVWTTKLNASMICFLCCTTVVNSKEIGVLCLNLKGTWKIQCRNGGRRSERYIFCVWLYKKEDTWLHISHYVYILNRYVVRWHVTYYVYFLNRHDGSQMTYTTSTLVFCEWRNVNIVYPKWRMACFGKIEERNLVNYNIYDKMFLVFLYYFHTSNIIYNTFQYILLWIVFIRNKNLGARIFYINFLFADFSYNGRCDLKISFILF